MLSGFYCGPPETEDAICNLGCSPELPCTVFRKEKKEENSSK